MHGPGKLGRFRVRIFRHNADLAVDEPECARAEEQFHFCEHAEAADAYVEYKNARETKCRSGGRAVTFEPEP